MITGACLSSSMHTGARKNSLMNTGACQSSSMVTSACKDSLLNTGACRSSLMDTGTHKDSLMITGACRSSLQGYKSLVLALHNSSQNTSSFRRMISVSSINLNSSPHSEPEWYSCA